MCMDDALILRRYVFNANQTAISPQRVSMAYHFNLYPEPLIFHLCRIHYLCDRYGIHLALALTNKVIERGYTPFVVIRPENDASRSLYTKLGYKKAYETVRVTLQPRATSDTAIGKLNGHCANGHIIDIQKDEGIEDMRALEIVQNISSNQNEVAKDEGIDNGEE